MLIVIIPFLLHISYISVNSWSSSHVSCIVCLVSQLVTNWAREWKLQVSVNKCSLLNIGHVPFDVTYHINGSSLSYQSNCRDLGVIITHDLSPSIHISEIVAKAHQRANIILRCFMSNDKSLLLRVFLVYVRPVLEYCSVVWLPCTKKDIDCIEKVQRQFTKKAPWLKICVIHRSFKMP